MTGLNPELQRNLWLELSLHRLIAAPIILGLVFALFWTGQAEDVLDFVETSDTIYFLMVLLWGTRRAAASVIDEIEGRTWDGQRLSALGAWSMTWGKLIGSTSFVWYCALIVLAIGALALAQVAPIGQVAYYVAVSLGFALFAQGASLMACLALLRRAGTAMRGIVTVSQLFGLASGLWFLPLLGDYAGAGLVTIEETLVSHIEWYGQALDRPFALSCLAAFLGWILLGCYRLMRLELQYRARPWAWLAFLIFVPFFLSGFAYSGPQDLPPALGNRMTLPVLALLPLVYLGLFTEPRAWVRQRAFLGAFSAFDPARLWAALPLWLLSYAALIVSMLLLFAFAPAAGRVSEHWADLEASFVAIDRSPAAAGFLVALLLFVLRDALLVLLLTLGDSLRRTDLAALIYLVCLYVLSGGLLEVLDLQPLLPLFYPTMGESLLFAIGPVALQVAVLAVLVGLRWRARLARMQ